MPKFLYPTSHSCISNSPEKADVKLQNYIEKYKENKLQVHDMPFFENLVPWPWNKNSDDTSTGVIEIIITHVSAVFINNIELGLERKKHHRD